MCSFLYASLAAKADLNALVFWLTQNPWYKGSLMVLVSLLFKVTFF